MLTGPGRMTGSRLAGAPHIFIGANQYQVAMGMVYERFWRAGAVVRSLAAHPNVLSRYLRFSVFSRRTPLELGLPWLPFAVIDRLAAYLKPEMRVFEFGCGGSTVFFARRVAEVNAVEENAAWRQAVRQRADEEHLTNVEIKHRPFDFVAGRHFEQSDYLSAISGSGLYDLILVDGTDLYSHTCRPHCFRRAETHVRPSGLILLDDSWRYQSLRKKNRARRVEVIEGVRPGGRGIGSTDLYFY